MADLSEIIGRLEKAEGPSRIDDYAIHEATNPTLRAGLRFGNVPNYSASIDSAVSLAERVLPGWMWSMTTGLGNTAAYVRDKSIIAPDKIEGEGYHATPAIALVLATLRALQQKGSSNG